MCECFEILCDFLLVADLVSIVQDYVHNPKILSDYNLSGFELYARFLKNCEIGGLRVSTFAPWILSGPKCMPYAEISITQWVELYNSCGQRKSTTDLRIVLTYVKNETQQYVSVPMRIRFADSHLFMDELFVPDGYDRFIKSVEWYGNAGQHTSAQCIADLSLEFKEVYGAITNSLESIADCIIHMGVSMFICTSS